MNKLLYDFLGSLTMFYGVIFSWSKLLNIKVNYKSIKYYCGWIGISILSIINASILTEFRIIGLTLLCMLFIKIIFNTNKKQTIVTTLFSQILVMISEFASVLFLATIFKLDLLELREKFIGTIAINLFAASFCIILVKIPFILKLYHLIVNSVDKLSHRHLIFFSLIFISIANVLTVLSYNKVDIKIIIFSNFLFSLICATIVFYSFRVQNNYNKVSNKYNVAINSLNDYENMITKYRIQNHENKNLLLTLRAMIVNKEKNIPNYIDSIVEEKYNDNEKIFQKVNIIPSGGLRATIYSEMLKIQKNKLNYFLNIDSNLKTVDLIELDSDDIIDICKIIGVFIDNAIDEVKSLKNQSIGIELYLEGIDLCIKISNNYKSKINIDKLFDEGYTTKGQGHGYGLSLVKNIIDRKSIFSNKIEINNNVFSQILIVKNIKNKNV